MMNDFSPVSSSKVAERRSTRLTARPAMLAEAPDDDMQVDSEYEENLAESSSRGKKRKSREDKVSPQVKKFRGKRGLLRRLVEMPLDLLFEVFGHLKPLDLLHLARTTKDLRAILMNRSSISIWKHARSQFDGLPDCPADLSEPQYAELLFGKACTFCNRNLTTNIVIWTARVRSCSRCLPAKFSRHINTYTMSYPRQLLDSAGVVTLVKMGRALHERIVYPLELHLRWEEEYEDLQTASEQTDWVTQKVEERKAINAHAKLCEKWIESMKQAQEMEKLALIDSRKAIVMERVTALGWADELSKMDFPDRLKNDPSITRFCQKDLTGRVLLQIDDLINIFMESQKTTRLRKERETLLTERLPILRKIYKTCVETYPVNSIIPCASDVFLDPVVQDLFMRPPLSTTFADEDLAAVGAFFPDIVLRWRNKTEEKLLNMIAPGQNISESLLHLATTIFSCRFCVNDPLTYPRVLVHRCATYRGTTSDEDQRMLGRFLECSYWDASNFTFDAKKIASLSEAIKLCGLDPKSATREDMDKQDPIFECLACNDERRGRCTLSLLGMFVHLRHHPQAQGWDDLKIELLGEEDAVKVRARIEEAVSYKRAQKHFDGLYCAHCKTIGDAVTLAHHVNEVHKIPEATNEDIVPVFDYPLFPMEHWLWPPRPVAPKSDIA